MQWPVPDRPLWPDRITCQGTGTLALGPEREPTHTTPEYLGGCGRGRKDRRESVMNVLVVYSSRYGSTREIAERLADRIRSGGLGVEVQDVKAADDLAGFDAFVIGSAVFMGHWRKDAVDFVRAHQAVLAGHPTWLFSSGPLGTDETDAQGHDVRTEAEPREAAEFRDSIKPREHRVFFGVLNPGKLGFRDRAIRGLPAGQALLPEGDFRDWGVIDAWGRDIAGQLTSAQAG